MPSFRMTRQEKDFEQLYLATPAPGKHCCRNALRHLQRAWAIAKRDPSMAAFRAITAEEEVATAVFHAIQRRKYAGSNILNPRDHVQKNALYPFCTAIRMVLAEADEEFNLRTQFMMNIKEKKAWVRFNAENLGRPGNYAQFNPPLHFNLKEGDTLHNFSKQLADLAASHKASSIKAYLQERANKRNRLLYAAPQGIPNVASLNNFLPAQRSHVLMLLGVYLLIDPYPEKQDFVQQGLLAFLKMLKQLPKGIVFE